jgi:hypothetical protein
MHQRCFRSRQNKHTKVKFCETANSHVWCVHACGRDSYMSNARIMINKRQATVLQNGRHPCDTLVIPYVPTLITCCVVVVPAQLVSAAVAATTTDAAVPAYTQQKLADYPNCDCVGGGLLKKQQWYVTRNICCACCCCGCARDSAVDVLVIPL